MLRGVAARARPAERPPEQRDFVGPTQRADVFDDRVDVIPVGRNRRQRMWIARLAGCGNEPRLTIAREITRIVHRHRSRRSPVPGGVHGEHVEARPREVRHPAVILIPHVERDFRRRAGAVHENDHAIGGNRAPNRRPRLHALTDVDFRRLSRQRRHGRPNFDVVIDREQTVAVVRADHGGE